MNKDAIIATVRALLEEGRTGFTVAVNGTEYAGQQGGYAVAERTFDTMEEAIDHLKEDQFLGYWVEPADGRGYFETVNIYASRFWATLIGLFRGQKFIYGFAEDEPIDISPHHQQEANPCPSEPSESS